MGPTQRVFDSYKLTECFDNLAKEARELYLGKTITELDYVPSALEFLRDFVSQNKPLIIRGGCKHWTAVKKWSNEYLRKKMGSKLVTVAITPNGYADAVCRDTFTLPEEVKMPFEDFIDIVELRDHSFDQNGDKNCENKYPHHGVFYLQNQNSCLTSEFFDLVGDVEESLLWAEEAFGNKPDAVNFWMGEEKAVTSMHKDNYENIYCVVRGTKTFTLLPPTDQPFIDYDNYPMAKYALNKDGSFRLDRIEGEVRWISIDPTEPATKEKLNPFQVEVSSGDVLYLPSLWFHHVQQTQGCIAVNYWHDMAYDIRYNYFKFVESLIGPRSLKL